MKPIFIQFDLWYFLFCKNATALHTISNLRRNQLLSINQIKISFIHEIKAIDYSIVGKYQIYVVLNMKIVSKSIIIS